MICLTLEETNKWLQSFGASITENNSIRFSDEQQSAQYYIMAGYNVCTGIGSFINRLIEDWLPQNQKKLIWLTNWTTTQLPFQMDLVKKLRSIEGERREIIDARGHLFNKDENTLATAISFLILSMNWEGFILSENSRTYLYMGDAHIYFASSNSNKLKEVVEILNIYKFKIWHSNLN